MADAHAATTTRAFVVDRSKLYHQVNAGTNRRQATNLRAPALTWHRAFWLQPVYTGVGIQDEEFVERDRRRKKTIIDGIILLVWSFIYTESGTPNSSFKAPECHPKISRPPETGANGGVDVYLLFGKAVTTQIPYGKLEFTAVPIDKLTQREAEIFNSANRVVSLKFSLQGMALTLRVELHSEYFTLTLYAEFPQNKNDVLIEELNQNMHDAIAAYFGDPNPQGETLNKFLFHGFWRNVFLDKFLIDKKLRRMLNSRIFYRVFADSRGLIIHDENHEKLTKLGTGGELVWGHQIEKQCLRLFTHHDRYECTGSYLLDGRAAYFTTLAPQFPEVPPDELIPLEYVLCVHQQYDSSRPGRAVNKWQLGRLVDRIHLLDVVRLAALTYLPALRKAGATLSHLDSYINYARETIDPKTDHDDAAQQKPPKMDVDRAISEVHSTFGRITSAFNEATETNNGILYRIEQSRYYIRQLDKNTEALRIGRLEGYQRYDQFIERRLGPAFDFIDRLGRRYERATNSIGTLDQNYLTLESNLIESGIRKIQEWGEFALLAALVPYYVTHLSALIVQERYTSLMAAAVWTGSFAVAWYRKFKDNILPALLIGIVATLIIAGLLQWADYSSFVRFPEAPSEQVRLQTEQIKVQKEILDALKHAPPKN